MSADSRRPRRARSSHQQHSRVFSEKKSEASWEAAFIAGQESRDLRSPAPGGSVPSSYKTTCDWLRGAPPSPGSESSCPSGPSRGPGIYVTRKATINAGASVPSRGLGVYVTGYKFPRLRCALLFTQDTGPPTPETDVARTAGSGELGCPPSFK
ncbi:uncharacterized protein LOC101178053 [Nomascus leucogenys]|uniref:uncharacterized protein LOC101178053 n=1 Tax=Nomascus leucogenys TaxID=61853 RepID=UPI00122DABA1|nr:uncharacterized protein LOC101178053 [Nomascus leucogenys]